MQQQRRAPRAWVISLAAIPLALSQALAAQSTAVWTAASGNHATPGNWRTGVAPLNSVVNTYIVQIDTGKTVAYTTTGAQAIDQLFLDMGSRLNLSTPSAFQRTDLTVLGQALIAGSISVDKGPFTALAAGSDFVGNATTVSATGGSVVKIGATAFSASGLAGATILNAGGAGSLVNLSGVKRLDAGHNSVYSSYITATSGAKIKLSGVTSLIAPSSNAALVFAANGGANINLASLQNVSNGKVNFNVASAGSLLLHGIDAGPGVNINLSGAGSSLTVAGSLAMLAGSTLAAGAGTRIDISGSGSFEQTVESQMNLDLATLGFSGSGAHWLEIGGRRNGTPASAAPVLGNFAIGQLVVGQANAAATWVQLVDAVNNGNRVGTTGEALYLNSDADGNGLAILGGSTLVIGSLDVYTYQSGQWVHLNALFKPGETKRPYDHGFVSLTPVPEPRTMAMLLAGLGFVAWRQRRRAAA